MRLALPMHEGSSLGCFFSTKAESIGNRFERIQIQYPIRLQIQIQDDSVSQFHMHEVNEGNAVTSLNDVNQFNEFNEGDGITAVNAVRHAIEDHEGSQVKRSRTT